VHGPLLLEEGHFGARISLSVIRRKSCLATACSESAANLLADWILYCF